MKVTILALLCVLCTFTNVGYAQKSDSVVIGRKYLIESQILSETREYWVSLPESYDLQSRSHNKYPLLIVLDGVSLFRPISGALQFMSAGHNSSRRVPEMVVVGIVSSNRERDYTPDKIVTRRENQTGGGDRFLSFLETELIPALENSFRLSPFRILAGHSLGGLLVSHSYLKMDSSFNVFLAIDPSFGTWDAATMDAKISSMTPASSRRYLYMATANWGARNLANRDRHVRFFESLHRSIRTNIFRAKLDYFEHETHGTVPLVAFYNGMSAAFDGYGMSYRDVKSLEQLVTHYASISDRLSYDFQPPEELVNRAGYFMLSQDSADQKSIGLSLFEWNAANYPQSFNAFDSLGEAYQAMGEKEKSIESFQKSLELNPENENAVTQLEKMN